MLHAFSRSVDSKGIDTKQHLIQVDMQQHKARQRILKRQRLEMPGLKK